MIGCSWRGCVLDPHAASDRADFMFIERHASAAVEHRAIGLFAGGAIIDAVAVAAAEPSFGAKPPNRVLDKAREVGRESGIELARIDLTRDALDNRGAAALGVAAGSIGMLGSEIAEDPRAVQEIVHQRIDRDHHAAGFDPDRPFGIAGEQQVGQRHRQHLIGDTVDVPERLQQRLAQPCRSVGYWIELNAGEPVIDPADDVAAGQIAHKQEEAVGGLV